jgi:hypothetical protein
MGKRLGHERSLEHAMLACIAPAQHSYMWANRGRRSRQSEFMAEVVASNLVDYSDFLWEQTQLIGIKYPYILIEQSRQIDGRSNNSDGTEHLPTKLKNISDNLKSGIWVKDRIKWQIPLLNKEMLACCATAEQGYTWVNVGRRSRH